MASAITDLIDRVTDSSTGRPVISSLASPKATAAVSLSLSDATNWTTSSAIHFSIYEVTAAGVKNPTTQTDWKGTLSGTTISNLTLTGGTDRDYTTGAKVELTPTARYAKDLYDHITAFANQDGTLKTSAVQTALNIATSSTDWTPLANTPTIVSSAGQKEHVIRYSGANYTDRIQNGTKLKIPRTGTTPTTSMAFVAASSQYASKTSPTGLAYTTTYTKEAWVYLNSYTSSAQGIIGRFDGTNGAVLFAQGITGQLAINASATTYQLTQQSIPLNKWTHVAGTFSSGTFTLYIDGVAVPMVAKVGAVTSITQAGNLQVGAYNSSAFLDGYVANARIWSTARTATEIRSNMNQETPTSTTGLVAHFKGNGSWNDSSSNANHLTAAGGAVNNSATHPYSSTEYAIVTSATYTGGNTDVTLFTGNGCLPNETLGATSYSSARAPFGFPASRGKWTVEIINRQNASQSSPTVNTWYNQNNIQLVAPAGEWNIKYMANLLVQGNATPATGWMSLSTAASSESDTNLTSRLYSSTSGSTTIGALNKERFVSQTTSTTYYLVTKVDQAALSISVWGNEGNTRIVAECAYL